MIIKGHFSAVGVWLYEAWTSILDEEEMCHWRTNVKIINENDCILRLYGAEINTVVWVLGDFLIDTQWLSKEKGNIIKEITPWRKIIHFVQEKKYNQNSPHCTNICIYY